MRGFLRRLRQRRRQPFPRGRVSPGAPPLCAAFVVQLYALGGWLPLGSPRGLQLFCSPYLSAPSTSGSRAGDS
ncbi:exported hypothetical protein [Verrucomicrobia bacterium]|nr:exported hypothetical protein [Verrucomicrobiota bacterium]